MDVTGSVSGVVAALEVPEVIWYGVQVEINKLVIKTRNNTVCQVEVPQLEVDEILFFSRVHSVLVEPE